MSVFLVSVLFEVILKTPSLLVWVFMVDPFNSIVAPTKGLPILSFTTPLMVCACTDAVPKQVSSSNMNKLMKRFICI